MSRRPSPPIRAAVPALVVLLALPIAACAQQRHEGVARTPDGTAVAYRESHWIYRDGAAPARLVLYRCPGGAAFARKTVREGADPTAPDFDFIDARTGYREGVRTRGAEREVFWQESAASRMATRRIQLGKGTVVDAGFDAWVRSRWAGLAGGAGQVAPFLVPSRLRAYDVRVAPAGEAVEAGRPVRRLRMRLAAWFGFALPDVVLTYDARDRRLLRYEGLGVVRDAKGRPMPVRIDFPSAPVPAGRGEIDAAARQALVTRCAA